MRQKELVSLLSSLGRIVIPGGLDILGFLITLTFRSVSFLCKNTRLSAYENAWSH